MSRAFTRLRRCGILLVMAMAGTICLGGCAERTYQLPPEAPSVIAADRPDSGNPPVTAPSGRGIIVPSDPASGTTRLGAEGSAPIETHTGTTGTRVLPGSADGK
jgi:hypothetical protein